jgi:hypothetical protein
MGVRVPVETLRRFWQMLAHFQGQLFNSMLRNWACRAGHPQNRRGDQVFIRPQADQRILAGAARPADRSRLRDRSGVATLPIGRARGGDTAERGGDTAGLSSRRARAWNTSWPTVSRCGGIGALSRSPPAAARVSAAAPPIRSDRHGTHGPVAHREAPRGGVPRHQRMRYRVWWRKAARSRRRSRSHATWPRS